jgi:hypothetical protein
VSQSSNPDPELIYSDCLPDSIVPFRARYNGTIVTPEGVPDGASVDCLDCGATLYQRGGPDTAQHFYHPPKADAEWCTARARGESDTHARCVSLAVDALANAYSGEYEVCAAEVTLDVSETRTTPDQRRADALLEFADRNPYFGRGIIIEVQYKHHAKDRSGTTHDYLSQDYSVAWLDADEFADTALAYDVVDETFRLPEEPGYAVRDHDPREFDPSVSADFSWEQPDRGCVNVQMEGEHAWRRFPAYVHPKGREYEFCRYCGLRRQYDDSLTRFVYDTQGVLAPEIPAGELRDAYIDPVTTVEEQSYRDWVESSHRDLALAEDMLRQTSGAPCRGPTGFHEWGNRELLESSASGSPTALLLECEHCPAHLLDGKEVGSILFGKEPRREWGLPYLRKNPRQCGFRAHYRDDYDSCPECNAANPPEITLNL